MRFHVVLYALIDLSRAYVYHDNATTNTTPSFNLPPLETSSPSPQGTATICNNSPVLCSRYYSNVTYLGAHDSPFVANKSNSYTISGNQFFDSPTQLSAGVRLLSAQIHTTNETGIELRLCHTDCSLYDAGSLIDWLAGINQWLTANPTDVVTILLVNSVDADATHIGAAFAASGITQHVYTPPTGTGKQIKWPTLGEMIAANTRLVTYVANLPDNAAAPYLLDQFSYTFENPYEVTSADRFSCLPDRPESVKGQGGSAVSTGRMFLMNHFLGQSQLFGIVIPDRPSAANTNSADPSIVGSLGQQLQMCSRLYGGSPPTYVLVDWFNVGPAIKAIDGYNNVTSPVGRKEVSGAILSQDGPRPFEAGALNVSPVTGAWAACLGILLLSVIFTLPDDFLMELGF